MQIFIGAENQLFGLSGCSMIVAPYSAGAEGGRGADRGGRDRRDRPDPHELRPHHSPGRLHRAGGQSAPGHTGYRDETMNETNDDRDTPDPSVAALDGVRSAAGCRRPRPRRSRSSRTACCAPWPRWRTCAAAPQREVEDARKFAVTGFARDLLEVGDNLGRALASVPAEARAAERAA